MILKPPQRCTTQHRVPQLELFVTQTRESTQSEGRTFIEALREDKVAFWMPHFHVFLIFAQLIDALLGELHDEHVDRDARHCVVLCLNIRVAPSCRELFVLAVARGEFARIRQWL